MLNDPILSQTITHTNISRSSTCFFFLHNTVRSFSLNFDKNVFLVFTFQLISKEDGVDSNTRPPVLPSDDSDELLHDYNDLLTQHTEKQINYADIDKIEKDKDCKNIEEKGGYIKEKDVGEGRELREELIEEKKEFNEENEEVESDEVDHILVGCEAICVVKDGCLGFAQNIKRLSQPLTATNKQQYPHDEDEVVLPSQEIPHSSLLQDTSKSELGPGTSGAQCHDDEAERHAEVCMIKLRTEYCIKNI